MIRKLYNADKTRLAGVLVDGKSIPVTDIAPEPTDSELAYAMRVLVPQLSKFTQEECLPDCREIIHMALREGAKVETAVKELIAMKHAKEDAFTLGKGRYKHLSLENLKDWCRQFTDSTPANRERWTLRFEAGLSKYMCPDCRFSGQGFEMAYGNKGWLKCPICLHPDPVEIFTRFWTLEEWKQHQDAEQQQRQEQRKVEAAAQREKERVEQERKELIESRATELRGRLLAGYAIDEASRIAASRLEFTVEELLELWTLIECIISMMDIPEEQDDATELLIARAIQSESESKLRKFLDAKESA